jgi:hypothetical protein
MYKDTGIMVDSKLYFHCHVDFIFSGTKDIWAYSFYYF